MTVTRRNLLDDALALERGEHVSEGGTPAQRVPRALGDSDAVLAAPLGEPDDDERVEQHGHRASPEDGLASPALRLLEAEALLRVVKRDFEGPAQGIAAKDLGRLGREIGRVEGLRLAAAGLRLHGDDAHGSRAGGAVPEPVLRYDARLLAPAVDIEFDRLPLLLLEHVPRRWQPFAAPPRPSGTAALAGLRLGEELSVEVDAAREVEALGQVRDDGASGIGRVGEYVEPPAGERFGELLEHDHGQFRAGAVAPAEVLRLLVPVESDEERERVRETLREGELEHDAQHDPAMAAVEHGLLPRREQRIVVH